MARFFESAAAVGLPPPPPSIKRANSAPVNAWDVKDEFVPEARDWPWPKVDSTKTVFDEKLGGKRKPGRKAVESVFDEKLGGQRKPGRKAGAKWGKAGGSDGEEDVVGVKKRAVLNKTAG